MRNLTAVLAVFVFVILVGGITLFMGCEGKEGPTGPAGSSGTALCGTCHNVSTTVLAKQIQWQNSVHATGGHFARSTASCAECHTNEGFRMKLAGETVTDIDNPTPQNCRTCHEIHKNYDETDYALSVSGPVEITSSLYNEEETIDIGKGNLCASCHDSRPENYQLAVGGGDYVITSSRFGPHHGPQSNILIGFGGYEVLGSEPYINSPHATVVTDGCITCHMAKAYGDLAGGHTMNMVYEYNESEVQNTAGCQAQACHSGITSFDVDGVQTEVKALLEELKTKLIAIGALSNSGSPVSGTWTSNQAGAVFNYIMLEEDRSFGVHNSKYIKALLKNSIEAL